MKRIKNIWPSELQRRVAGFNLRGYPKYDRTNRYRPAVSDNQREINPATPNTCP